tara:strand:- start:1531 stop:2892 length:1362 start_codon:yes stop_codon:yes gene_type:complete
VRKGVIYPPASNESNSRYAYYGRLQYEPILSNLVSENAYNRHIDLIIKRPLYGKVNHRGNIIDLNNEGTMAAISSKNNAFCIDFVADAFKEFQQTFENYARSNGGIELPKKKFKIDANKGYESALKKYQEHNKEIRDFFIQSHLGPIQNAIITVNDVASELLRFVRTWASEETITYSSFLLSSNCSHFSTGLSLDIMDEDYGDDSKKNDLILSEDYESYTRIAAKAGFKININAPWNLIANLSSKAMKKHMSSYGIESIEQFFQEYYVESYAVDLSKLKQFIIHSFYQFLEFYPDLVEKQFCNDGTLRRVSITPRDTPSSFSDLSSEIDSQLLTEIYLSSRYSENVGIRLLGSQLQQIRDKAFYRLSKFGDLSAFKYIDKTMTELNPKIVKLKLDSNLTSQNIIGNIGTSTESTQSTDESINIESQGESFGDYGDFNPFPGSDGIDDGGGGSY